MTALGLICIQISKYEEKLRVERPPGWDTYLIQKQDYQTREEQGLLQKDEKPPLKPVWEKRLPTLIIW